MAQNSQSGDNIKEMRDLARMLLMRQEGGFAPQSDAEIKAKEDVLPDIRPAKLQPTEENTLEVLGLVPPSSDYSPPTSFESASPPRYFNEDDLLELTPQEDESLPIEEELTPQEAESEITETVTEFFEEEAEAETEVPEEPVHPLLRGLETIDPQQAGKAEAPLSSSEAITDPDLPDYAPMEELLYEDRQAYEEEEKLAYLGEDEEAEEQEKLSAAELRRRFGPLRHFKHREIQESESLLQDEKWRGPFLQVPNPRRFKNLKEAVSYSRENLPLPREMQLAQKQEHRTWLIAQLKRCNSHPELSKFAFSLNYKDIAILFPTLATLKQGEEIDRIISIIMMRASKYLYLHGWVTLQYAYPRSTVQKGLSVLCEVLESQASHDINSLGIEHARMDTPFDTTLAIGADRFDWKSVHLISEISLPNTRHFISSIIRYLRDSGMSGDDFFRVYGIYRDLPLGQAIRSQWEMSTFEDHLHSNFSVHQLFRE